MTINNPTPSIRIARRVLHSHSSIVPLGTLKSNNGVYDFVLFRKAATGRLIAADDDDASAATTMPDDDDGINIIVATITTATMHAVRTRTIN